MSGYLGADEIFFLCSVLILAMEVTKELWQISPIHKTANQWLSCPSNRDIQQI